MELRQPDDQIIAVGVVVKGDTPRAWTSSSATSASPVLPAQFSPGLHAATLCTDWHFPEGSDAVPCGLASSRSLERRPG